MQQNIIIPCVLLLDSKRTDLILLVMQNKTEIKKEGHTFLKCDNIRSASLNAIIIDIQVIYR